MFKESHLEFFIAHPCAFDNLFFSLRKVKQDMFEKQPKGSKPTEDESEVLPEQLTKKQYNAVQTAVEVFGIDLVS